MKTRTRIISRNSEHKVRIAASSVPLTYQKPEISKEDWRMIIFFSRFQVSVLETDANGEEISA